MSRRGEGGVEEGRVRRGIVGGVERGVVMSTLADKKRSKVVYSCPPG